MLDILKSIPLDAYTVKSVEEKVLQGLSTREDDFVENLFITSTHDNIIFFTNLGRAYKLKAYEIPEAGRTARGTNIVNIIPMNTRERIQTVLYINEFDHDKFLFFTTKNGIVKRSSLDNFRFNKKNWFNCN